jgi:tripartite-type tricarboxylate transporter receptor subunit TctC
LNDPDTRKKLTEGGADVDPMSVAQFHVFVQRESKKYNAIIKETGVMNE